MQVVRRTELCEGDLATEFYNAGWGGGGGVELKSQRWVTFNEMSIYFKTNSFFSPLHFDSRFFQLYYVYVLLPDTLIVPFNDKNLNTFQYSLTL